MAGRTGCQTLMLIHVYSRHTAALMFTLVAELANVARRLSQEHKCIDKHCFSLMAVICNTLAVAQPVIIAEQMGSSD